MGDVFVLTYSDLLEEIEAVVSHHLLSFDIQVDSGLGLRLYSHCGVFFGAGRSRLG